jgi:putative toxin-antitoxin system antitoxin component (TIGR02293 family)
MQTLKADRIPPSMQKFWAPFLAGRKSPADVHNIDPMVRTGLVKLGLPAGMMTIVAKDMGVGNEKLSQTIGVKRSTMARKIEKQEVLNLDESDRVMAMARLIGQVKAMVMESGTVAGFDAGKWVARWIEKPAPALGGKRPAELLDTTEGREIVSALVAKMQSGAYA